MDSHCHECGMPFHIHEWEQLALDHSHIVYYRGRHCGCRIQIDDAYIIVLETTNDR